MTDNLPGSQNPAAATGKPGRSVVPILASLLEFWHGTRVSEPFRFLAVILVVALLAAVTIFTGAPAIILYGRDTFIPLDGAWRILNGQSPHRDFYTALGPLIYLIDAGGLWIARNSINGLAYATALTGSVVGIWTYLLVRTRLIGFLAVLVSIAVALLAFGPYPIGEPYYHSSYAMQYNRYGYALLTLVALDSFLDTAARRIRWLPWADLFTGAACGLLLLLKVSYFVAALAILFARLLLNRQGRRNWAAWIVGFGLVVLFVSLWLRIPPSAMLQDWRLAGLARAGTGTAGVNTLLIKVAPERLLILMFALLACLTPGPLQARNAWIARFYYAGAALAFIAVDTFLSLSNTQRLASPLDVFFIAIVIDQCSRYFLALPPAQRAQALPFTASFVLLGALIILNASSDHAYGMMTAWKNARQPPPADISGRINAAPLNKLVFVDYAADGLISIDREGRAYVSYINDGLALIRRESRAGDTVQCLCFSNPFPYALLRPPPKQGSAALALGYTYTATHMPDPMRLLGDADLVMVPRQPGDDQSSLVRHCAADLASRFQRSAESAWWILYKRR